MRIEFELCYGLPVATASEESVFSLVSKALITQRLMPLSIGCANPHSIVMASEREDVFRALASFDVLIPDGIGVVYASKLRGGQLKHRITGSDLFRIVTAAQKTRHHSLSYFVGSTPEVHQLISNRFLEENPTIAIRSYSPSFSPSLPDSESDAIIASINSSGADVVWVGMTAPKQELWIAAHMHKINCRIICGIGAVFDFYAGTVARPGRAFQAVGAEWLVRLIREPRRLWRRTLISGPKFARLIARNSHEPRAVSKEFDLQ